MQSHDDGEQRWGSVNALAKMLAVSPRTIWRLCQQTKMPKPIRYCRNARWRLDIISQWIKKDCPPTNDTKND
jgi:predicted DNA-binding transcriptional regulator AlpA